MRGGTSPSQMPIRNWGKVEEASSIPLRNTDTNAPDVDAHAVPEDTVRVSRGRIVRKPDSWLLSRSYVVDTMPGTVIPKKASVMFLMYTPRPGVVWSLGLYFCTLGYTWGVLLYFTNPSLIRFSGLWPTAFVQCGVSATLSLVYFPYLVRFWC